MKKTRLKRLQEHRYKTEKVIESLDFLKVNNDVISVVVDDCTHETGGYFFSVDELIKNAKIELKGTQERIDYLIKKND